MGFLDAWIRIDWLGSAGVCAFLLWPDVEEVESFGKDFLSHLQKTWEGLQQDRQMERESLGSHQTVKSTAVYSEASWPSPARIDFTSRTFLKTD